MKVKCMKVYYTVEIQEKKSYHQASFLQLRCTFSYCYIL